MALTGKTHLGVIILSSILVIAGCNSEVTKIKTLEDKNSEKSKIFVPGDAVRIFLPLDTGSFLNGTYPIDNAGKIVIPAHGQISVIDYTSDELRQYLQTTYQEYLHYPEMQIEPLIRVSLQGGFVTPGFYYVRPDQSLWNLIALAGGTTSERGLKKMRWERSKSIKERNLIPALESGKSLRNLGFKTGDQIWTPVDPRTISEIVIRDILPIATFALSLYLGIRTLNDD